MNKRRVYSTNSRGKVYHFPGCRYAVRIPEKYAARQTKHSLDSAGYRPCRCCNVMKFRVEREFQGLSFYCKDKNMEFQLKSGILYVETEIGCWKLVYRADLQNFALYHRNDTGQGYKIISLFSNIYDKISYKDIYGQYGYGYCLWNVCFGFMLTIRKKQMRMIKSTSNLSSAKAAQLPVTVEKHTELTAPYLADKTKKTCGKR